MNALLTYFQDALAELRQVRWPTRHQAIRLSIIVIVFTLACTVILGAIDFGLSELLKRLLSFAV